MQLMAGAFALHGALQAASGKWYLRCRLYGASLGCVGLPETMLGFRSRAISGSSTSLPSLAPVPNAFG